VTEPVVAFERGESTAERLAHRLTEEILDGHIRPGTRLREEALAARFQVSRTPIREALLLLGGTGLVALERNRGATVLALSEADVAEVYHLRGVLESESASLAAARIGAAALDQLDRSCDRLALLHDAPASEQLAADTAFHYAIAEASGSPRLGALIRQVCTIPEAYRSFMAYTPEDMSTAESQHRAIAAALRAGRRGDAGRTMQRHVRWAGGIACVRLRPMLRPG
jgi:DNA-binding GntR family transcriptional regulator